MDDLLQIRELRCTRGPRLVLKGLDLTVRTGETLGLLGRNGAGKSTLVDVITGRLRPDDGHMTLGGEPYAPGSADDARAAGVSVIEQEFAPPTDLSVAQAVLRTTQEIHHRDGHDLVEAARWPMEAVGLEVDPTTSVGAIDPAQQALVEVARVLAERPRLVVVDEASVPLDDREIALLHHGLRQLQQHGATLVYIAHRLDELHAISDRVAILRDGVVPEVLESRTTSAQDLSFALLRHAVDDRQRREPRERGEPVLHVRGLRTERVHGFDVDVDAGEVVGVVGTRTSGALEALQAIAGERGSDVETFVVAGEQFGAPHDAREVVTALGGRFEYAEETIAETLGQASAARTAAGKMRDAAALVRHLDIATSDIHGPVANLSGGDRQKVTVASAGRVPHPVVVLSQPTRSVDVGARRRVHEIVDAFVGAGKAVLLVTHDLGELVELSHRVVVVHEGRVAADLVAAHTDPDEIMTYAETGEPRPPVSVRRRRRAAAATS